jgi:hypothetical protein
MSISSWFGSSPFLRLLLTELSAVGGGFGAAGVKARPLTFLRFIERGAKASDIPAVQSPEVECGGAMQTDR